MRKIQKIIISIGGGLIIIVLIFPPFTTRRGIEFKGFHFFLSTPREYKVKVEQLLSGLPKRKSRIESMEAEFDEFYYEIFGNPFEEVVKPLGKYQDYVRPIGKVEYIKTDKSDRLYRFYSGIIDNKN